MMKGQRFLRFDTQNDTLLSLHKVDPRTSAKYKNDPSHVGVIDLQAFDVEGLCNAPVKLKKGSVVAGLNAQYIQHQKETLLVSLMADYLKGQFVDLPFDEALPREGQRYLADLETTLERYGLSWDAFREQYEHKAQQINAEQERQSLQEAEAEALASAQVRDEEALQDGIDFSMPCLAGRQGGQIYYSVVIPFTHLVNLFGFNEEDLPVEFRAQRQLNENRAQGLANYICQRRTDFVLPALTASVSDVMRFKPVGDFHNMGLLFIPTDANILINDGQHRRRGIELALKEDPSLAGEHVTVELFYDQGLQRSQQMFADINNNMVKPAKALSILFDKQNVFNRLVLDAIEDVGLKGVLEYEKASPGKKSHKLWSITAIKKAIELMTGLNDKKCSALSDHQMKHYRTLITAWLAQFIHQTPGLSEVVNANSLAQVMEARKEWVITHAAYLHAVAIASQPLLKGFTLKDALCPDATVPTFDAMTKLSTLHVQKTASLWQGRIVKSDGTMDPSAQGIKLGAYMVLKQLEQDIPAELEALNGLFFKDDGIAA